TTPQNAPQALADLLAQWRTVVRNNCPASGGTGQWSYSGVAFSTPEDGRSYRVQTCQGGNGCCDGLPQTETHSVSGGPRGTPTRDPTGGPSAPPNPPSTPAPSSTPTPPTATATPTRVEPTRTMTPTVIPTRTPTPTVAPTRTPTKSPTVVSTC